MFSTSNVVATCALAFTIAAFWWLNARPGKVKLVGAPSSYAFACTDKVHFNLPLTFTNPRPMAATALSLRLRLDTPGFPDLVPFQATRQTVNPQADGRAMSSAIVLQGRETRLINCEFIAGPVTFNLTHPTTMVITVEGLMPRQSRTPTWRPLLRFPLRIPQEAMDHRSQYLTYSNGAILDGS